MSYRPGYFSTRRGQHPDQDALGETNRHLRKLLIEDLEVHDKQDEINSTVQKALEIIKRDVTALKVAAAVVKAQLVWQWIVISAESAAIFYLMTRGRS